MTDSEIRAAVARGHGRAVLFLRSERNQGYFDLVLDLCGRDQAFDRLFEDRIDYVWRLGNTLPVPADLVEPLGARLSQAKSRRDRMQVRRVLGRFREAGNEEARKILLRDFYRFRLKERSYRDAVDLLGFEGLELLLSQSHRLKDWELRSTYDDTVKQFGKRRVDLAFMKIASNDVRAEPILSGKEPERPKRDREALKTAAECIRQLREGGRMPPEFIRVAAESDWIEVAQMTAETTDDAVLKSAQNLFRYHPWPLDVESALRQALAEQDASRRRRRLLLLRSTKSGLLREWGLAQLSDRRAAKEHDAAFDLLETNARHGDREEIANGLRHLIRDAEKFHGAGISVLNLCIGPTAELCHLIYEYGRCDLCRNSAVRELAKRHAITDSLLRECVEDSDGETRRWARVTLGRRAHRSSPSGSR